MENEKELKEEVSSEIIQARKDAQRVLKNIRKAQNAMGDRINELQELLAFYEGKQYELSKYKTGRPWVVRMKTPYSSVAVDIRVSSLIASDYFGELQPMNPDDEEPIKALRNFIGDEWERLKLDTKIDEAIKSSAIVREAYLHFYWEDKKLTKDRHGYVSCKVIDQNGSLRIDPTANSLREARWVGIVSRMSIDDFEDNYPEFAEEIHEGSSGMNSYERGEVSFWRDYETEQSDVLTVITYYEKRKGVIRKLVVVEDLLVEEVELDGLTCFPIAQMRWKRASGSPYGISLMDDLLESQKAINAIESAIVNTAVSYSAPSYAVRKGSGLDPKQVATASGVPGVVFSVEGDINNAIQPIKIPSLDNAILGVKNDFIIAIDRTAGITNPYLGSIGTSGNTAQGTKMALDRAKIIEADVLHNVETFVEDITHILVQYTTANYAGATVTTRRVDRTNGKIDFTKHRLPENLDELDYTFYVDLNTKTSYSKEREKEMILELYQMQHQYKDDIKLINQLDILEAYDLSNKEMLIERFEQLMQQTNAEKAQIIAELVANATALGIPMEQVQQAIVELMSGSEETPFVDGLMQQMQQMAQQGAQNQEQAMQSFEQNVTQAGMAPGAIQAQMAQLQGGGM